MKMIRRAVLAAITATLVLVAQPLSAGATADPDPTGPYPPQCVTDVDNVSPGLNGQFTVTISGDPINNGEDFIFTFQGLSKTRELVNGTASASFFAPGVPGDYPGTVVLAPDIPCGTFTISVASGVIPPTGSDSTRTGLMVSAAAVGLGGLMVAVAYRRRRQPEPELVG